ncbi:superfamily II DNA or RNA helicase [Catalinimonas alkaloidigena]|uniref:DEAD/DEAH box helicase family protein n=1 Tax=Catalinimonas alkaloidigena TaxID=1075417 RepID=UPI002405488A|nr:DEAD/DEAH box helicase family protein [Catalinimonas alkaloidigena]MDF9800025.1 superfamily II DNA or RNA helicase [Catalinimonas alkaloidigena]
MKAFPSEIRFKYNWRKYQKRVLDELEEHLKDDHLHIIAPPGSGKTVLGLEVALRLNKPTLIFAPTVAIRNQWVHRFCELFLQVDYTPDWISRDIRNPKFLTVVTYQALHTACSNKEIEEEGDIQERFIDEDDKVKKGRNNTNKIIRLFQAQQVGTIVVDEAHHLKSAWWKSLTKVKDVLKPTIVGLTATPPYDVSYAEWQRYTALNGPVDAEISVPELVVEGDLCPHQDYVYFSRPTNEENEKIRAFFQKIRTLYEEIKVDEVLVSAIEQHPIYCQPAAHLDWIYNNLEYYSATLIYLHALGKEINDEHTEIIGDKEFSIPPLNYEWMEILLTFYFYKDPINFSQYKEHQHKMMHKLIRNGAIERRTINFRYNHKINRLLSSSISKLDSIENIVTFEHQHLGQNLRMVILTDYIRKEFLTHQAQNNLELNKIGVLPIFEKLRRTHKENIKLGVLTGSLIIIPKIAERALREVAYKYKVDNLVTTPLPYDDMYLMVNLTEQLKLDVVHIITQIFQQGNIEVLVGTKSLLGEGWDAPAVNALILASFVGSYVLSNQMRGRAIRTERHNYDKTANIWHLVCANPEALDGGDDIKILKRRFRAFVGVSFRDEINIENGYGRLNLPHQFTTEQQVRHANAAMLLGAGQRDQLREKWQQALSSGTSLVEEILIPFPEDEEYRKIKSLYYTRTIKSLIGILVSGFIGYGLEALQVLSRIARHLRSREAVYICLAVFGSVGMITFGGLAFKTLRLYIKYRDIAKDVHQIGEALLVSLIKVGAIHTDYSKLRIISSLDDFGTVYCHLEGGTTYEKSVFIKALQETISIVDNPRYLIIRKNYFLKIIAQKDYHAVPEVIGGKKQFAEFFQTQWSGFVGKCDLIYTRTIEGRKLLLKARINSLASEFEEKAERINKWR